MLRRARDGFESDCSPEKSVTFVSTAIVVCLKRLILLVLRVSDV